MVTHFFRAIASDASFRVFFLSRVREWERGKKEKKNLTEGKKEKKI